VLTKQADRTVLLVSDAAQLGGSLAASLRQRGLAVEHTDPRFVQSARWAPSFGRPDLVEVDLFSEDPVSEAFLQRLTANRWLRGVLLIILSNETARLVTRSGLKSRVPPPQPTDLGEIMYAPRFLLSRAAASELCCVILSEPSGCLPEGQSEAALAAD
jgi:hypothetical protein